MTPYIGFLPCRAGSERVINKNVRPFAGFENGLIELKLRQMCGVKRLEKVIVSSNDQRVLDYCDSFRRLHDGRVEPVERPDELGRGSTAMDDFILYIAKLVEDGVMVWSHVTSPFVRAKEYDGIIDAYERATAEGYDSLITVNKIHKFLWDEKGPINYSQTPIKWPRSQDIKPIFEINHAAYVMPFAVMRDCGDRIGRRPYFMPIAEEVAMDIDWEEQFVLLEQIARVKMAGGHALV